MESLEPRVGYFPEEVLEYQKKGGDFSMKIIRMEYHDGTIERIGAEEVLDL